MLYWGVIEWAYYYQSPPEGVVPLSGEALEWAASYPLFHWGFTAWAFYALPTVAVAYSCHRGGEASYRLSAACRPLIGDRADSATGRAIDVLFIVGILGGASTSLGLSTPLIAQGVTQLTGMERWFGLDVAIVLGCGLIFATSVYLGLDRGIRTLSNLNLGLALAFVIFVVAAGDSGFILQTGIRAVGHVVRHFVWMNLWNDPVLQTDWTVFYWAWWIAYAPFVGLFVARISRGRSIRQVVLGMLLMGTAGSWVFFIALGSYAMSLEVAGVLPVVDLVNSAGAPAAIIAVISTLPAAQATVGLFCLIALLYLATTFDSAAYTIAAGASLGLGASGHPSRAHRSFWAVAVGALPIALMTVGGLKSLQTASLVASAPSMSDPAEATVTDFTVAASTAPALLSRVPLTVTVAGDGGGAGMKVEGLFLLLEQAVNTRLLPARAICATIKKVTVSGGMRFTMDSPRLCLSAFGCPAISSSPGSIIPSPFSASATRGDALSREVSRVPIRAVNITIGLLAFFSSSEWPTFR